MKTFVVTAIATASMALPALAGPYDGMWLRPSTGAHIQAFDCGGGLGLKVVKSDNAATIGKSIICGAKSSGDNQWSGIGVKVDDGSEFKGTWTLSGDTLKLRGCLKIGFPCQSENWKRIK
ncbi:MAG: DUF2147 domain-containing protein [Flavobacteriaceae bacterium]|nr:DUF2147 domain-containing protein [Rhodobiaceae bacterium]